MSAPLVADIEDLYECAYVIAFIKQVGGKVIKCEACEHFVTFSQRV